MANLRDLFPDSSLFQAQLPTNVFGTLYVYNTNVGNVNNGGQCCLWTVPTGAKWARFEVWGGGGDGGGACCCQQPSKGGGSGSYARRTIRVVPGQTYTLCAAGSGCCSQNNCGTNGFSSYACNASATYPLCLCASGGEGGSSCCWAAIGGNYHCSSNVCGSTCNADFAICGIQGSAHQSWCGFDSWHYVAQGPYIGGGMRPTRTHCGEYWMGCDSVGGNIWPGGGGGTAISYGGCCWGGWGAGGLVVVTYK